MTKNPKLTVIMALSALLLLGLITVVLLSTIDSPDDDPPITAIKETNDMVATRFAQTATQQAITSNPAIITNQSDSETTSTLKIEAIPVPTTTRALTAVSE